MPHHCYHIYHRYHHSSSVICIDVRGPCFGRSLWASRSHDLSQHRGSVRRPMSIIPYPSDPHIAGTVSCYFKPLHTEAKRQSWVVFIATKDLVVLLQPLRTGIWTAHHWSTISKLFADSPNISNNYLHPELFGSFWSSCCALQNATLGAMPRHLESLITLADRTQQPQQTQQTSFSVPSAPCDSGRSVQCQDAVWKCVPRNWWSNLSKSRYPKPSKTFGSLVPHFPMDCRCALNFRLQAVRAQTCRPPDHEKIWNEKECWDILRHVETRSGLNLVIYSVHDGSSMLTSDSCSLQLTTCSFSPLCRASIRIWWY
jgi:hypothetical protein